LGHGPLPPCEICGAPALYAYLDIKETDDDPEWATWEPDGPQKIRCGKHRYVPKTTYLDGSSTGGYDL